MNTGKCQYIINLFILTALLWIVSSIAVFSQEYTFGLETVNVEDGLPHRNTNAIVQDAAGFIWVSTQGAISRYDGYRFKTYSNPELNIPEFEAAMHLAVDIKNRLWYCGRNDISGAGIYGGLIDSRRDSIYTMETVSKGRFTSTDVVYLGNSKLHQDVVIIITHSGNIYEYDGDFKEVYRFPSSFSEDIYYQPMPDGSYWLSHDNELLHIKDGKRLQTVEVGYPITKIILSSHGLILKMRASPLSNYWILKNDTLVAFSIVGDSPKKITELFQLHKDYTCYSTVAGLFIRNLRGNIIYKIDSIEAMDFRNFFWTKNVLKDRQNILWITTLNGLLKLGSRKNVFKTLEAENSVRGIYQDGKQLWIGSHGNNVVRDTTHKTQKEFWSPHYGAVSSFYKDHQGYLWMGTTRNHIIVYIPGQDRYINYYFDIYAASFDVIFQNTLTKTYWTGTKNGIFRVNTKSEYFRTEPKDSEVKIPENNNVLTPLSLPVGSKGVHIRQFYQNSIGIWIVTNKGIFLMDARSEKIIKHYTTADGLPANNINHLYEDGTGIFWLGTKGKGLVAWNPKTGTFRQYTSDNGLSNNNIYAVYEDDFNTLWLPSDYGLMGFDKATKTTKVYLPQHGIAHEGFNTYSHFQDEDGTLYFGGLSGVTRFHPAALHRDYSTAPPLYATAVSVLEKNAATFTDKTPAYVNSGTISLSSGDQLLEVTLTLLDYEKSAENRYAYKLSGKQEQWVYTTTNKVSILNPPYGRYNLVVKARGASGTWSGNLLNIPVYVPLPFYLQWWFILTVLVVLVGGIFSAFRARAQKFRKDRERLEDEVQKRTRKIVEQAEELKTLNKAKTRFFSNITHEFRTPLTLVTGPVEQMLAEHPPASLKKD